MCSCSPWFLSWDQVMVAAWRILSFGNKEDTSSLADKSATILLEDPGVLVWPEKKRGKSQIQLEAQKDTRRTLEELVVMLVSAVWNLRLFPWHAVSSFVSSPLWENPSLTHFNGNTALACELLQVFMGRDHCRLHTQQSYSIVSTFTNDSNLASYPSPREGCSDHICQFPHRFYSSCIVPF